MERERTVNKVGYCDDIYQTVGKMLYKYDEIKAAVKEYRAEKKAKRETMGIRSIGTVSDPTRQEAEIDSEEIRAVRIKSGLLVSHPEKWIEAMDKVFSKISKEDMMIIRLSFWSKDRCSSIVDNLNMATATYYKRKERIISLVAISAAEMGLIHIK